MSAAAIIELLSGFLRLAGMIFGEYLTRSRAAAVRKEEFRIDQEAFIQITAVCLDRLRAENRKESEQAQDMEDRIDQEVKD